MWTDIKRKSFIEIVQTPTINRINLNVTLFDRVNLWPVTFFLSYFFYIYGIKKYVVITHKLGLNVFSLHISVTNDIFLWVFLLVVLPISIIIALSFFPFFHWRLYLSTGREEEDALTQKQIATKINGFRTEKSI